MLALPTSAPVDGGGVAIGVAAAPDSDGPISLPLADPPLPGDGDPPEPPADPPDPEDPPAEPPGGGAEGVALATGIATGVSIPDLIV